MSEPEHLSLFVAAENGRAVEVAKKERAYRALDAVLEYADEMAAEPAINILSTHVAASLHDLIQDQLNQPSPERSP